VVDITTQLSPFEIVCGFNPLIPLDLLPLPNTSLLRHKDGKYRAKFVKKLHEQLKVQIKMKNEDYAKCANKGSKRVVLKLTDWVCVHMRKRVLQNHCKLKVQPSNPKYKIYQK